MKIGEKYLITTLNWFFAPDGQNYKAVFGTVHALVEREATLGVKTNRQSSNWYVVIGDTVIAGCQVFYAIRTDAVSDKPPIVEIDHEGQSKHSPGAMTRIYNADASGLRPA